jgi:hypothetical protein
LLTKVLARKRPPVTTIEIRRRGRSWNSAAGRLESCVHHLKHAQHSGTQGLKIFVVDQLGANVVAATNPLPRSAIGYKPTALEESLQKALIGASRRPLSSTFARSDEVERQKIERFFLV